MQRLFAGTKWDRPPVCERCGRPEAECSCPPASTGPEPVRLAPGDQTARLRVEKRARGKLVTVVSGLDPSGSDLPALASRLKARCGAGGTVKGDLIELQGDHVVAAESALQALGYKTRRP
jgi:translation initiation factor 1